MDKIRQAKLDAISEMKVQVPIFSKEKVIEMACKNYNDFHYSSYREIDFQEATAESDEKFLNRIVLNFLRHKCTKYEKTIDNLESTCGKQEAYKAIKDKINNKIIEIYGKQFPFMTEIVKATKNSMKI